MGLYPRDMRRYRRFYGFQDSHDPSGIVSWLMRFSQGVVQFLREEAQKKREMKGTKRSISGFTG